VNNLRLKLAADCDGMKQCRSYGSLLRAARSPLQRTTLTPALWSVLYQQVLRKTFVRTAYACLAGVRTRQLVQTISYHTEELRTNAHGCRERRSGWIHSMAKRTKSFGLVYAPRRAMGESEKSFRRAIELDRALDGLQAT